MRDLSTAIAETTSHLIRHAKPTLSRATLPSLPLDRTGRLRGDVVDDAVDAAHLVDDPGRRAPQELVREGVIVGGHAVGRSDRPQRADVIVGAPVAHDADALHR